MSSILFAIEVTAFLLVVVWAGRNDRMAEEEGGSGLFALKPTAGSEKRGKPLPRWRKNAHAGLSTRRDNAPTAPGPRWKPLPAPRRR